MKRHHTPLRAMAYSLLAFTIWSIGDCFTKTAGKAQVPLTQIIVISSVFCILTIAAMAAAQGRMKALRPKRLKLGLLWASLCVIQSFLNVTAFTHLPLATVYIGLFTSPMIVALLAALFLREALLWRQIAAIVVGFGGVLLAFLPEHDGLAVDSMAGLIALVLFPVFASISVIFMRVLGRTETKESMAVFPHIMRVIYVAPLCIMQFRTVSFENLGSLASLGFCAGVGSLFMIAAIKKAPAGIAHAFQYSQLVTGALFGYLIWNEVPSPFLMAGGGVIIAAGLYLVRATKTKQREELIA